jgi:4-amino-4-deoxy-L-arabinose transferase-like glycosyltransferase
MTQAQQGERFAAVGPDRQPPLPAHGQQDASACERAMRIFILILAGYFLLQIVVRLCLSDSLDLDEAEQVFVFQQLRGGYDTQPPLYAWVQWVFFSVFGLNLFALSLLKNLLLLSTYLGVLFTARRLLSTAGAIAATASLVLLPAIGWESQRDLTHSVILTCMASLSLCAYFALLHKPNVGRYVLFGLLVGLGMLTKYNFVIFAGGIALTSLLVPEHRRIVWNGKVAIAMVVAVLVFLPHGVWLAHHLADATNGTLSKMSQGHKASYLGNVAEGFGDLLVAMISFLTPLWIIDGWLWRKELRQAKVDRANPHARFFLILYAVFFIGLTVLLLTGKVSNIKSRWMLPLMFSVPMAVFVIFPAFARQETCRKIAGIAGVFAVVILLALPARVLFGPMLGKNVRAHFPFPELSAELAQRFPQARLLVTDAKLAAGNLHFQRPALRTMLFDEVLAEHPPLSGEVILLIRPDATEDWLRAFKEAYPSTVTDQGTFKLRYRYGSEEFMSFDFVHVVIRNP